MKLLLSIAVTIILAQITFARRYNRMGNPNAIMAALQTMMGPQNYEKAMSMMRMGNRWSPAYEEMPIMPQRTMPHEINVPNMRIIEPKCPYQMDTMYPMTEFIPRNMATLPVIPNEPVATVPLAQMAIYPQPVPEVVTLPVPYPIATPVQEKRGCACPCSSSVPMVSPFLPSASPVSPWAPPTSNLLPPVTPNQVKSHFLRKIPIPPPTL